MEEPEAHCEEDKALAKKNRKRLLKTPSQLQGLEEFYNEHKYPTESLKAEIAEKLGLTEKQVSGWFCHRRLKDKRLLRDEKYRSGRQDLSSGVIQDHDSGLKQDSCSSTKQGDYKLANLKEAESRRVSGEDLPAADLHNEQRRPYGGSGMYDTSSESNSQEGFFPQNRSPPDMGTSKYVMENAFTAQNRGRTGPSGYLKIKGQTENVAITAVKRQLGRHYREDGPPLGIEFDPLPPGAFESPNNNTVYEPYGVAGSIPLSPLTVSGAHEHHGLQTMRNPDLYVEPADIRPLPKSDHDNFSYHPSRKKSPFPDNIFSHQKSSFGANGHSVGETSVYDKSSNHTIRSRHGLLGVRSDSFPDEPSHSYGGKFTKEPTEPWLSNYDDPIPRSVHRGERLDSKPAGLMVRRKASVDDGERTLSKSTVKDEDFYGGRRDVRDEPIRSKPYSTDESRAGKRGREEFLHQGYSRQELAEWTRPIRRSAMERPASFSEDETAETSSSVD